MKKERCAVAALFVSFLLYGCQDFGSDYSLQSSDENTLALAIGTTYALTRERNYTQTVVGVQGTVSLPDIYQTENLSGIRVIMGTEDSASACSENNESRVTNTDVDGSYAFNDVPEGSYQICAKVALGDGTPLAMVLSKIAVNPTTLQEASLKVGDLVLGELVAQTATIHLFVVDALTDLPIANAPVTIWAAGKFVLGGLSETMTGKNGYLSYGGYATQQQLFNPDGPNDYTSEVISFVISKEGYNTVVTSLANDAFESQAITVTIALEKVLPIKVGTDSNWGSLQAGEYHLVGLKQDGNLFAWGNYNFASFISGAENKYAPTPDRIGEIDAWHSLGSTTSYVNFTIKKDGSLWAWFDGVDKFSVAASGKWQSISADNSIAGVAADGSLWAWLPIVLPTGGTTIDLAKNQVELKRLGNSYDWKAVFAPQLALKNDGTLWRWNKGRHSLPGATNVSPSSDEDDITEPIQIGVENDWVSADKIERPGGSVVIALKADGSLWAHGRLSTEYPLIEEFVQISADNDWKTITAHRGGSLMIRDDGTLWRWDGDFHYEPEQVGVDTDWAVAAVSPRFGAAIKTDGTLWAWGNDWWDKL